MFGGHLPKKINQATSCSVFINDILCWGDIVQKSHFRRVNDLFHPILTKLSMHILFDSRNKSMEEFFEFKIVGVGQMSNTQKTRKY